MIIAVIIHFINKIKETCEKSPDPSVIVDHVGTASSHSCRTEQSDKSTGPVFLSWYCDNEKWKIPIDKSTGPVQCSFVKLRGCDNVIMANYK